ncbi:MAG TPA: sn-glycerol-3-phosphate ABC transporter ATP-binding protein UgpC [Gemmatimonadaceae bacterium]|jgi:multiple sugar transport system ATP-binding protein|nr:sn-glycerol-3-phosphate ABC transporter ATP-binding protein UgpC [Gemmatimonadaceae bacterium]
MARVKLEGIRKMYQNSVVAVHGVDLDVADGEFVVLVGPSGCGKSTTLRMIAGLESITDGKLYIGDRLVNDVPPKNRDIAMVFQSYALYPHMTVRDNLAFALKLRGTPKQEIDTRVNQAAKILGIEEFLDRTPRQLSGGQRQRVALGRAIVRQPQVFLFDEPLSNLDAQLRVQMRREIARLHQELTATMIYVTHDQVEAMTLGDRIVVMSKGHVMQIDTPMNLYDHPRNRFVAGFIGSPAMNFIDGTITAGSPPKFVADGNAFTLDVPPSPAERTAGLENRAITLGIRPEDVSVAMESGPTIFAGESTIVHPPTTAPARLELVEALGNEVFIYASVGQYTITARIAPQPLPRLGEPITLAFDLAKSHFFDRESGDRVGKG